MASGLKCPLGSRMPQSRPTVTLPLSLGPAKEPLMIGSTLRLPAKDGPSSSGADEVRLTAYRNVATGGFGWLALERAMTAEAEMAKVAMAFVSRLGSMAADVD